MCGIQRNQDGNDRRTRRKNRDKERSSRNRINEFKI